MESVQNKVVLMSEYGRHGPHIHDWQFVHDNREACFICGRGRQAQDHWNTSIIKKESTWGVVPSYQEQSNWINARYDPNIESLYDIDTMAPVERHSVGEYNKVKPPQFMHSVVQILPENF